jgi:hypothetical protein
MKHTKPSANQALLRRASCKLNIGHSSPWCPGLRAASAAFPVALTLLSLNLPFLSSAMAMSNRAPHSQATPVCILSAPVSFIHNWITYHYSSQDYQSTEDSQHEIEDISLGLCCLGLRLLVPCKLERGLFLLYLRLG